METIVIKYGGNAMTDLKIRKEVLKAIVELHKNHNRVIMVHGGGPNINKALKERNIESKFIKGLRYTDEKTMEVVVDVLSGGVNKGLVVEIQGIGGKAVGLSGADNQMITAKKIETADMGFVGEVEQIDSTLLELLLEEGFIPVISTVGYDKSGQAYNINADMAACHIAGALKADKMIFMTDVDGVLTDVENPETLINSLTTSEAEELMHKGIINGGMIPKVKSCLEALKLGSKEAMIINGKKPELLKPAVKGESAGTRFIKGN